MKLDISMCLWLKSHSMTWLEWEKKKKKDITYEDTKFDTFSSIIFFSISIYACILFYSIQLYELN